MMNGLSDNQSCSVLKFERSTTSEQTQSDCDNVMEHTGEIITDEIATDNVINNTTVNNNFKQLEKVMDEKYGHQSGHYAPCPRKPRDYSHLHATINHIALTLYSLKRGLKEFGTTGLEAVQKELQQLHDHDVLIPVFSNDLSVEQHNQALPYLMFLRQKRTGQVNGRRCADGWKQRNCKFTNSCNQISFFDLHN